MQIALPWMNLVVSFVSAAWAVVALVRPGVLSGSSHAERGELFYVRMYAARSIPFGLVSGVLPFWPGGAAVPWVLFAAAVIQAADVALAVGARDLKMALGASIAAVVHTLCGLAIL